MLPLKGGGFPISPSAKAKEARAEKSTTMRKSTKRSLAVQFPTGGKARDKGFDKSIVAVVAFLAIPIEMIEI
jgi:hypothetical protein